MTSESSLGGQMPSDHIINHFPTIPSVVCVCVCVLQRYEDVFTVQIVYKGRRGGDVGNG